MKDTIQKLIDAVAKVVTDANLQKMIAAGALLGGWGFLAYLGKTPIDGFITAVAAALAGLGVHTVNKAALAPPPEDPQAPALIPPATPK